MRNRINLHTVRDDTLLGTLKFVSKTKDYHKYGALIPDGMINQDIMLSTAYETYLDYATRKVPPEKARKFKKPASSKLKTIPTSPKEPTQKEILLVTERGKVIELLSDVALLDDAKLKETLRKSKQQHHKLQASGSSKGANLESKVDSEDESDEVHDEDNNDDDDDGNDDDSGGEDQQNASHESGFVQEEEDAYVTLTIVHDKTEGIVDNYLASKLKEEVNVAVRLQSNKHKKEAEAENQEFINQVDSTMKKIINQQVKAQVSKIMQQIENYVTESLGAKVLKPDKSPTPNRAWNKSKSIDFRPPQKWISTISKECYKEKQPPRTACFQPTKRHMQKLRQLEYHFEECYKAVNDRLDWHNPEGREYSFDVSKPLPLIEDRGHQVVPTDYFITNDLEYLKGGSSSRKYATSTTRTKAAIYDNIEGIKILFQHYGVHVKVMRWYDYGYLEDIVVLRDDNVLYKFKEGDLPRLNLRNIEDMLLLLVQKKLSNLDVDVRYDFGVAIVFHHYHGGRKVHIHDLIDSGATISTP
nr:hypothetical protein [Tanacetum cinerariifolium]